MNVKCKKDDVAERLMFYESVDDEEVIKIFSSSISIWGIPLIDVYLLLIYFQEIPILKIPDSTQHEKLKIKLP